MIDIGDAARFAARNRKAELHIRRKLRNLDALVTDRDARNDIISKFCRIRSVKGDIKQLDRKLGFCGTDINSLILKLLLGGGNLIGIIGNRNSGIDID